MHCLLICIVRPYDLFWFYTTSSKNLGESQVSKSLADFITHISQPKNLLTEINCSNNGHKEVLNLIILWKLSFYLFYNSKNPSSFQWHHKSSTLFDTTLPKIMIVSWSAKQNTAFCFALKKISMAKKARKIKSKTRYATITIFHNSFT